MANSLLDFVMSLVRDPDAAARYAADPTGTIADAHLTDVSSADVNNLIPVVSESVSMTGPLGGVDSFSTEPAGNVWASGAATAAFDAFDEPAPTAAIDESSHVITDVVDQPDAAVDDALAGAGITADPMSTAESLQYDPSFPAETTVVADDFGDAWAQPAGDEHQHVDDAQGFDLFD